jgi:hypothetical protein
MPSDLGAADETDSTRMVASDLREYALPSAVNRPDSEYSHGGTLSTHMHLRTHTSHTRYSDSHRVL